jgi:hypothetical protein
MQIVPKRRVYEFVRLRADNHDECVEFFNADECCDFIVREDGSAFLEYKQPTHDGTYNVDEGQCIVRCPDKSYRLMSPEKLEEEFEPWEIWYTPNDTNPPTANRVTQ